VRATGLPGVLALHRDQLLGACLDGIRDAKRARERSDGVVRFHEEKAALATRRAASTSPGPETGAVA